MQTILQLRCLQHFDDQGMKASVGRSGWLRVGAGKIAPTTSARLRRSLQQFAAPAQPPGITSASGEHPSHWRNQLAEIRRAHRRIPGGFYGGEGGIRTQQGPLDCVSYRFHDARGCRECQRCRRALHAIARTAELTRRLTEDRRYDRRDASIAGFKSGMCNYDASTPGRTTRPWMRARF
jgi:hypothetical protein